MDKLWTVFSPIALHIYIFFFHFVALYGKKRSTWCIDLSARHLPEWTFPPDLRTREGRFLVMVAGMKEGRP